MIAEALALHALDPADALGVLAAVGGLEIAAMAGFALEAARLGLGVVLDGLIAGAAALVAVGLDPALRPRLGRGAPLRGAGGLAGAGLAGARSDLRPGAPSRRGDGRRARAAPRHDRRRHAALHGDLRHRRDRGPQPARPLREPAAAAARGARCLRVHDAHPRGRLPLPPRGLGLGVGALSGRGPGARRDPRRVTCRPRVGPRRPLGGVPRRRRVDADHGRVPRDGLADTSDALGGAYD